MIRIATRRSPLAKWQANHVADLLRAREPGLDVRLHELVTKGDKILAVALARVGGKGLFVKEIEDALLAGDAEIAVHSMKDLPAVLAAGADFYRTPILERAHHEGYWQWKAGGSVGHKLGIAGSSMMVLMLLYSVRKRVGALRRAPAGVAAGAVAVVLPVLPVPPEAVMKTLPLPT